MSAGAGLDGAGAGAFVLSGAGADGGAVVVSVGGVLVSPAGGGVVVVSVGGVEVPLTCPGSVGVVGAGFVVPLPPVVICVPDPDGLETTGKFNDDCEAVSCGWSIAIQSKVVSCVNWMLV